MQLDDVINTIKAGNKRVVLYGANHLSELAIVGMFIRGVYPDIAYDRSPTISIRGMIHGIPLAHSDRIFDEPKDAYIFLVIAYDSEKIKTMLHDAGYQHVYDSLDFMDSSYIERFGADTFRPEFECFHAPRIKSLETFGLHEPAWLYETALFRYRSVMEQLKTGVMKYISSLIIVPGTKCNLRCVDCCADLQYFDKNHEYSVEAIKESLDRMFTVIDYIGSVVLSGCEPFMNKNMMDIVRLLHSYKQIRHIGISTNAGVLPPDDVFIELGRIGVELRISDYGDKVVNWSQFFERAQKHMPRARRTEVSEAVQENGVWVEKSTSWLDQGGFTRRHYPKASLDKEADTCPSRRLLILYEDRLYHCWRSAACMRLGILPDTEDEVLHMRDASLTDEEFSARLCHMANFVGGVKPLRACDYCNGRRVFGRPTATQVDHKMDPYEKDDRTIIEREAALTSK